MSGPWEKLTYTNARGESIVFSRASKYHTNFKDVEGLSDVLSTVYTANSVGQDGETLVDMRIESRVIQISGHLRTTDKLEKQELRRRLNRTLNPHQTATLTYELAGGKRVIKCIPRSAPTYLPRRGSLFDEFVVQLLCLSPFWRDSKQTRTDVAAWVGLMEFPTETGGLEIIADEWQIGERTISVVANIVNSGDVDTGMKIAFNANGTVVDPMLTDMDSGEFIRINTTMEAGDQIVVTTGYGEKEVLLIRNGAEENIFRLLDIDSTYLQIRPGDNLYRYDAAEGVDALDVVVWHSNLYTGV